MKNQKGISTLYGIIIIVAVIIVVFSGIFTYQYFATKTLSFIQMQQNQNKIQDEITKKPTCANLYWFDNTNDDQCQSTKQFCGAYMYYGLKTFKTQQDCLKAFNIVRGNCTPNWICGWDECINGYQSQVAVDSNNCGLPSSAAKIACTALAKKCTPSSSCVDSDGGKNYNVKGYLSGICTGKVTCGAWIDTCQDANNLVEYFCDGTNYGTNFEIHRCPNGCENGACK